MSILPTKTVARKLLPQRIDPAHVHVHDVDRGPNWLFVRLTQEHVDEPQELIEELRDICARHFVYRLVLELDQLETFPEKLGCRLAELDDRLASRGGALRLCGMNHDCEEMLGECRLSRPLHNHLNRHDAVLAVLRPTGEGVPARLH
ncbi:hypothetical protein Pla175_06390 [Pirellulimonas nuda]|uniref:STAS domain-containing protein n=1 Tax=Pirellulimonas nuda TaxID=2528009 RepID=A0A518D722_9BACT|nr:hypothetical protein [Pirellulimonas nuda]QDU87280.1 hypothetical protein Pla175_06390 [Pirellulimonas nuda]